MLTQLRELLNAKRAGQVQSIKYCVANINHYKVCVRRCMERTPALWTSVNLDSTAAWRLKRWYREEMKNRAYLAEAAKRLNLCTDGAFIYKAMELIKLVEGSGIVLESTTKGSFNGMPVQLVWDVHLNGPAVSLRVKPYEDTWWRRAGNATYYTVPRFNNKMLDVTLGS